jgi:hypothetical protein
MREHKPSIDFKVISFEADHVADLVKRNSTPATAAMKDIVKEYIECMAQPGHGFTLIRNGHAIMSGGIYPVWKGLGEAWVIPSDLIRPYKKAVVHHVKKYMDEMIRDNDYRRIQSTVRADFTTGQRFIEFLGFRREAFLQSYGPDGADHISYSRVIK